MLSNALYTSHQPLTRGSYTSTTACSSPPFSFATAAKAQVKLDCVSLYMTPPLSAAATATSNNPSARFALRSYALLTLLRGVSVNAVGLEDDWDVKQVDNIATAHHKSEEADERAVHAADSRVFHPHAEGH